MRPCPAKLQAQESRAGKIWGRYLPAHPPTPPRPASLLKLLALARDEAR